MILDIHCVAFLSNSCQLSPPFKSMPAFLSRYIHCCCLYVKNWPFYVLALGWLCCHASRFYFLSTLIPVCNFGWVNLRLKSNSSIWLILPQCKIGPLITCWACKHVNHDTVAPPSWNIISILFPSILYDFCLYLYLQMEEGGKLVYPATISFTDLSHHIGVTDIWLHTSGQEGSTTDHLWGIPCTL